MAKKFYKPVDLSKMSNNWCLRLYKVTEDYDVDEVLGKLVKYDRWCYCLHDKDTFTHEDEVENPKHVEGSFKKEHYHVVIHSNNAVRGTTIVNYLGIPNKDIIPISNFRKEALYLVHFNEIDKYQYSISEVVANFDYLSLLGAADSARAFTDITTYIIETDCKSWRKLTAWCIEHGYYQMLMRGAKVWDKIMYEVRTIDEENINYEVHSNGT